jgi:hypothetical protein
LVHAAVLLLDPSSATSARVQRAIRLVRKEQHMVAIRQGIVVSGVQSTGELIPALLRELERLENNAREFGAPRADEFRRAIPADPRWLESADAEAVVEDLICALSDCTGDARLYFGRRQRASSEFGFWCSED